MANITEIQAYEIHKSTGQCVEHGKFIDQVVPYKTNILQTFCKICSKEIKRDYLSQEQLRDYLNRHSDKLVVSPRETHTQRFSS